VGPPTRSAIKIPEKGGINMNVRELSLSAIIAALYAVLVIFLAPISFDPIQLRVADALIPLSALAGPPAIIGVTLGALIANAYGFISAIDVVLGPLANFIAAYIIFRYRNRMLLSCIAGSIIIGSIVGSYLWLFFPPPNLLEGLLPLWLFTICSLIISSLITVAGLGYLLVKALKNAGLEEILKLGEKELNV
jgi:uncharacterized membrane protein